MNLPSPDTLLFFFINRDIQNGFFDVIMPFITRRALFIFLPFCALFFLKDRKKALTALVLGFAALLLADWAANSLKHLFARLRPCNALEGVRALVGCGKSFSMPSNHAVNAFAFMTPFYVLVKNRMRYAFPAVAALVAFSRIYVGVHYPSDVVVGAAFGVLLSLSLLKAYGLSSRRFQEKPLSTVLIVSLAAISIFRIYYLLNGPIDLSPDEAHYWEWSRRLDLSYYSKGPMIAYLISLGTSVFGDTVFGIRIMAVIFSALSSILMYGLGKRLYNEQAGLSSALLIQIIPLFSVFGIVFTIDSPFIFFWILSLFLFWEAFSNVLTTSGCFPCQSGLVDDDKPFTAGDREDVSRKCTRNPELAYWCLLGFAVGFGLLTKYTMAFFYPCAFLFLLFSKERRSLLMTKGPYVAALVSLLVFSPVILWNANHDWVTLRHTAGQAHVAEGIRISAESFFEFIGSQLGVITPLVLVLMGVSVWKLRKGGEGNFLLWFSVPIFAFFLFKSAQAKVQANWALPCYITGIVAFSELYLKPLRQSSKGKRALVAAAVILSLFVTAVAHYSSMLNLPAQTDPASRLKGWRDLGAEVSLIAEQMSRTNPVFIFSDRYQVSSELAFYVKGHPTTYCINLGRRMNQYDLWPGFNKFVHYDAIFVRVGDTPAPETVSAAFRKVEKKVFTAYTKNHTKIRDYSIFLCHDFRGLEEQRPEAF